MRQSALVMKIIGWGLIIVMVLAPFVYAPGFIWGRVPIDCPLIGPPHPDSPYEGFHPYVFMIAALYLAWAILMIRGANDPKANAALFDFGILANVLHALVMIPQAFVYPGEHAHMWADIPGILLVSLIFWIYHPNRVAAEKSISK